MYKLVKKSQASVREIASSYKALNYITKETSPLFSLAVNVANEHTETETTAYDRIYYVLSGELSVEIDGTHLSAIEGDSLFISKNTTYQFSGTFEAVVVNQPAFGT